MRKNHIFWITGLLTICFAAGLLLVPQLKTGAETSAGTAQARTRSAAPVPVVTAEVVREPFTETLSALGTAKANESVLINPTVEERVVGIYFDDGDTVRKGQVLVKLDDSEAQFLLSEAKATLQEQKKQYARMQRLIQTNATSQSQLDEEQSLLEIAEARVAHLQARLQDYTIRAPFSGVLGIRQISAGAVVDSDTIITTLDDTDTIKLDFTVPETFLGVLSTGMEVAAHSPAYPESNFNGTVTALSSRVDPETRTVIVRAGIPNTERLLKPGMLLTVDLVKDRSRALIIPEEAVILEKDRSFVLVVTAESTVAKTEIITGRRSPGKVEVTGGLEAGQQVIVQGITRVRPGAAVNVVEVRRTGGLSG
jgi:membrane fusion protein (multidrug efflux system)